LVASQQGRGGPGKREKNDKAQAVAQKQVPLERDWPRKLHHHKAKAGKTELRKNEVVGREVWGEIRQLSLPKKKKRGSFAKEGKVNMKPT